MQILIVAATKAEIEPLVGTFGDKVDCLITGVGMTATSFALGKRLATQHYDLAINLGIAGSFDREIALGEVVEISEDIFSELGAEDDERFLSLAELGFGEVSFQPTAHLTKLVLDFSPRQARGITVNTVHGNTISIREVADRLNPQVESMEGAAFFYACRNAGVPCLQIRAISNYVEKRNRDGWKIGLAVTNLNDFAISLVAKLIS